MEEVSSDTGALGMTDLKDMTGGGFPVANLRRSSRRPSLDTDEFINVLHGSDPIMVELNRMEIEIRDAPPKVHEETRSSEANFSRLIHFGKGTADLVQIIVQPLHLAGAPAHLLRPMRGPNCGFGSRVQ
ncbi:hypothetical protein E3N88_02088 [Mikania micrantha]|uniref:Uncharacterized protein n=1 Tax=Mikania micrantha TaxID=192012 RepID=A0A5N6Q324_9ASTR|nr:hypothetical protein E3N88_02088 [Mikania micrantha]